MSKKDEEGIIQEEEENSSSKHQRSSWITTSSALPPYSENKRKGKSPAAIKIDEPRETIVISMKKKGARVEEFLRSINRSSKSIDSPKEEGSEELEPEKEMMELDDNWDEFDFMDFEPIATPLEHSFSPFKEHINPSD